MSDKIAIKVHDLHKSFDFAENKRTSIKQLFVNIGRQNKKKRQKVLNGINFEIKKGEFFGIVGRNGSGKSTLLKLIAGVYTPDSGAVVVNGDLTPFIELGVGFNPELSGRDNVYLSASLLGFTRKQVDKIYDEIVDFAELQEHMDQKLKNYSSGMQVRLAFAIAVKAKNDILVFDEVLAVGDEAFQQKCINVFQDYKRNKQTVVFVTHDMAAVKDFCDRAVLINDGEIVKAGSVDEVINHYHELNS
jgi:ABC-2 type transport system ATP-binding protein